MGIEERLERAQADADTARDRLVTDLLAVKDRLMPARLFVDLVAKAKGTGFELVEAGTDAIKARPVATTGIAALLALFLARKPLARAISRPDDATPPKTARSRSELSRKARS